MKVLTSIQLSKSKKIWFLIILLFGFTVRFLIFLDQYYTSPSTYILTPQTPNGENLYFKAITEHLWEYLWFSHTIMPLNHLKDWVIFSFFDEAWFKIGNFVLISIANSFASALVYLTLRNFNLPNWLSIFSASLLSIRLLGWDFWFISGSWDFFNPILISLMGWAFSNYWVRRKARNAFIIGVAGLLLAASLQTASVVVIPSIGLFILFYINSKKQILSICYALIPPMLLIGVLLFKNGVQHNIYAPSSGAGQNIIQNLNLALTGTTTSRALELGQKLDYPEWWVWCYREAEKLGFFRQENLSGFYGTCNQTQKGYTFTNLKKYLRDTNNLQVLEVVKEDEKLLKTKPWLFSGQIPERATKFSILYGKVSSKLLIDTARLYPRNYLGRTYLNLTYLLRNGPRFEMDYPRIKGRLPSFVNKLSVLLEPLLRAGMYLAYILTITIPIWFLSGLFKSTSRYGPTHLDGIIWILCVGFTFATLANVGLHCCESYRHAFPFITQISIIMIYSIFRIINTISQKNTSYKS